MPPEQPTVDNPPDAEPDESGDDPDIFPTQIRTAANAADAAALAQAERAVARHAGTPEEVEGVAEAGKARRAEDRSRAGDGTTPGDRQTPMHTPTVRGDTASDGPASGSYDTAMIEVSRHTPASVDAVWAVLADGFQYAAWVVGAARVRAVDDDWPAPGTRIHHSAGIWPLMLNDTTTVLSCVPARELVMQARGWPAGEARVELELLPSEQAGAGGCRIVIREDATHGPGKLIPGPLRQLAIGPRNVETLKRLAYLAERPRG